MLLWTYIHDVHNFVPMGALSTAKFKPLSNNPEQGPPWMKKRRMNTLKVAKLFLFAC